MKTNNSYEDSDTIRSMICELGRFIATCKKENKSKEEWKDSLDEMLILKGKYKQITGRNYDPPIKTIYQKKINRQPSTSKNAEKNAAKAKLKAEKEAKKVCQRKERELRERKKLETLAQVDSNNDEKRERNKASNYGNVDMVQSHAEITDNQWISIKDLCADRKGSLILTRGYIHASRLVGKGVFLLLRSSIYSVQCVCFETKEKNNSIAYDNTNCLKGISRQMVRYIAGLPNEAVVDVKGHISVLEKPIQSATQQFIEIQILSCHCISQPTISMPFLIDDACRIEPSEKSSVSSMIENINTDGVVHTDLSYCISNKSTDSSHLVDSTVIVSQELRLDHRHIDLRTHTNQSIFRIKSNVGQLFRSYLLDNNFIDVHTPKLISGASEGGSDVFTLDYFGKKACLAMSPQLHKQILAACSGFERVFEIGPVFRAENSNTRRHLCEFTGMDLEMAFYEHYDEVLQLMSNLFLHIFDGLNEMCKIEIELVKKQYPFIDLKYLKHTLKISYAEGCQLLRNAGVTQNDYDDLSAENEKLLGTIVKEKYETDFFIMDKYPLSVRPFYTMPCPENPELSNSYDFFIRGQEILSGAQRIHDPLLLIEHAKKFDIPLDDIQVYIDSFRNGALPHGGGGIGLERFVMLFLDLPNIRKASCFPRDPKRISP